MMRPAAPRIVRLWIVLWGLLCGIVPSAGASVYLNEVTVRGDEFVELYNRGPGPVVIAGWRVEGVPGGAFVFPAGTTIAAGGYLVFDTPGDIFAPAGGEVGLIDIFNVTRDRVFFGRLGSAPLPEEFFPLLATTGPSLARAPDAAFAVPPPPSPLGDGQVWTLDYTPTFGLVNDAPNPMPGRDVVLNELNLGPDGNPDEIELYNPTADPILIQNWFFTNGAERLFVSVGVLLPFDYAVVTLPPSFQLEAFGLLYLFSQDGTRVDQLGYHDGPPLLLGECYGRCPDGAGPNLGFDWPSSGGFFTFLVMPCTPGAPNLGCDPTAIPPPGLEGTRRAEDSIEIIPSVARERCQLRWQGANHATPPRSLEIIDLSGRCRARVPVDSEGVGLWSNAGSGDRLAPGVYFVRSFDGRASGRFVLIR
ncbi:MAG: lamin tail domain-containing protein [Candidatus Eisenbacteria bacterium]|nr:lamin tail domain-containing protein [Candidatus Eisenbacteria bacterium]MCC7142912.1 lamin tail domain-containing protein [Candidatus Eisenbacteria bacterium]